MSTPDHQARLQWQCRRGMLELDIILGNYLRNNFMSLSAAEKIDFENLLSCQDQDLFNWLVHKQQPTVPTLVPIVSRIIANAASAS